MSIELLLLGVNILFIISSIIIDDVLGQLFGLLLLIVAGAESAIGLGLIVTYYRVRGTVRLGNYRDVLPRLKFDTKSSLYLKILPKSSISSAVVVWQIMRHVPRSVKAQIKKTNYKTQLIPYVKADNKNRFRFFVTLRERSCVLFPVPEDVVYSHAFNDALYSAQIQLNCQNHLLFS